MDPIQSSINEKFGIDPGAPAPLALAGHVLHRAAMPLGTLVTRPIDGTTWGSPLVVVTDARWVEQLGVLHFEWSVQSVADAAGFSTIKKKMDRKREIVGILPRQLEEQLDPWRAEHPPKSLHFVYDYNEALTEAIRLALAARADLLALLCAFGADFKDCASALALCESVEAFAAEK